MSDPKQQDLESVEHVSLWLRERSKDTAPIPFGRVRDRQDEPAQRNPDETVVQLRPLEDQDQRASRPPDLFAEAIAKALQQELEPQFVEAPSILQKRSMFGIAARVAAAAGVAALGALVFVVAFPAPQGTEQDTWALPTSVPTWQSLKASLSPTPPRKPAPTLVVRDGSGLVNEPLPLGVNVNSPSPGVTVTIDRIPTGARLTAGKPMGISEWRLPAQEISGTTIIPPPDFVGTMNLTAELRGSDGVALVNSVVRLTWTPAKSADTVGGGLSVSATPAPFLPALPPLAAPMPQPIAAPVSHQAVVAAPSPQPIAAPSQPEAARVEQPVREINPREVAGFVSRAQELLATGDLQAARLFLLRAVEAHDARAALSLAKTYDPTLSKQFAGANPEADLAQARNWYQKAQEWGAPEAKHQLDALASFSR